MSEPLKYWRLVDVKAIWDEPAERLVELGDDFRSDLLFRAGDEHWEFVCEPLGA